MPGFTLEAHREARLVQICGANRLTGRRSSNVLARIVEHPHSGDTFIRILVAFATAGLVLFSGIALQPVRAEYPEQPVRFIVPWPPGDLEDALTRLIAEAMQAETGTPAVVVNAPGGDNGPYPGAARVARAEPDGYTIGSFASGVAIVGPLKKINGIKRDTFEPIGIFLTYPFVIAAGGNARFSNMTQLASYARSHDLVLGHPGYGSVPALTSVVAGMELGFEFGSDAFFESLDCGTLASGDADVIITTLRHLLPCLRSVKVLASLTEKRIARVPSAATLGEQVEGIDVTLWNGLFVPKGTPAKVKARIAAIASKTVLGAKAQKIASDSGADVYWQDANEAQGRVDADYRSVKAMYRRMGGL